MNESGNANSETMIVSEEEAMMRLDAFLVKHFPAISRAKIQRAVGAGAALVDGQKCKPSNRLKLGQAVSFQPPEVTGDRPIPEDIPLDVIFEDDSLVVINKPPAMVVHPAKGHWSGTLTAALVFRFDTLSSVGGDVRPGIVHRLDRDTSGVIIVAKTDQAHANLALQFEKRLVEKEYWAIVSPVPDRDRDLIDQPIGAHPYQREKKAIRRDHSTSRDAQTYYEVAQKFDGFAVVKLKPKTGRTHQLRVHLAHIGCSVLCDRQYSGRSRIAVSDLDRNLNDDSVLLERQALHARRIKFKHPETEEDVEFSAELSEDLKKTLDAISQHRALGSK